MHPNALGSDSNTTDYGGNSNGEQIYAPFGQELVSGGQGIRFAGMSHRDQTGFDITPNRDYSSTMGRWLTPDPVGLKAAHLADPQTWNRYSYARNNPLEYVDSNGKWPTSIHNQIIDTAFPTLSASQRQIVKEVSAHQDAILSGGQGNSLAFQHAMRGPGESVEEAQADYSTFVSMNEDQATKDQVNFWLAGNPGYSDKALTEFGAALHAILDSTSPAHAGFQVWDWTNLALVLKHTQTENTITPQQLQNAVSAARNAFNMTFNPYNYNEFDLLELTMKPRGLVTSRICWIVDNGKTVCQ